MKKRTIDFIFDFGSPNAYLCWKVLPAIAEAHDASIRLIPCLLGGIFKATGNRPPIETETAIKGKFEYSRLEIARFVAEHRLDRFRHNPHFPVNTLLAMRGMIASAALGIEDAYRDAVLAAMWEDGRKMDDPETFVAVLNEAGLDGAAIAARTQEPAIKQALADNTAAAVARGVFGIPTFFVGNEMFFGKERLGQIEALLASSARSDPTRSPSQA